MNLLVHPACLNDTVNEFVDEGEGKNEDANAQRSSTGMKSFQPMFRSSGQVVFEGEENRSPQQSPKEWSEERL